MEMKDADEGRESMKKTRDVFLTIGKRTYSITTPLDDETLSRVQEIIDDVCGAPSRAIEQEDLMLLACLKLAYSLGGLRGQLAELTERQGRTEYAPDGANTPEYGTDDPEDETETGEA